MDRYLEEGTQVGKVEVSRAYEVQWQVDEGSAWAARIGGEYHTVELPDGRLALLRWVASESDARGYHCRSLYLGALRPNEPGLTGIELPPRPDSPIFTATKAAIRAAFWQNPEDALQIGCLTGTGDRLREWLCLRLSQMNRHLGIFAQSGSGKSYAVGRLIEELLIKVKADKDDGKRRVRIIILDPNGDFSAFSKFRKHPKILLDLEKMFQNVPAFIPDYSWEDWIAKRMDDRNKRSRLAHVNKKFEEVFSDKSEGIATWHVVDLQKDSNGDHAVEVLEKICSYIFGVEKPEDRHDLTFIVIDEAHNLVPRDLPSGDSSKRAKTQEIVNKLAGEGRKYGAFLIIISQSPSKVHHDTLSQCANLMVMKLTRRDDINTIADLRTDIPLELIERIARFSTGDALFIGDYVPAPATARVVGRISEEGGSGPKV